MDCRSSSCANPRGFHVDLSGQHVTFALYGDDTLLFTVWTGQGPPPPHFPDPPEYKRVVGRNGQIRVVGQYISAVVMLHRRSSDFFDFRDEADVPEDECWVEVIPAISEEAVPLPDSFFNGPNDLRWRYDRESERIERVKQMADAELEELRQELLHELRRDLTPQQGFEALECDQLLTIRFHRAGRRQLGHVKAWLTGTARSLMGPFVPAL